MHRIGPIRTPDQRLRVFVSSTLRELQGERRAVRAALERLRVAPVMFELGARPHPPQELYRAYLAQSDVFVGLYAAEYGWVAPGEAVSGLEDEYRHAPPAMPKLIYLKDSGTRDARLEALIDLIRSDDTASYKSFSTAEELGELVSADLATLLAERFDAVREDAPEPSDPLAARVPSAYTRLIGRDEDVAGIVDLLAGGAHRVVTLLGPGGIGKSRLAIATAEAARPLFPGGVVFVGLENVFEPSLLLPAIAYALGIRDTGEAPLERRLSGALEGRRTLLLLDNFEQLAAAAPVLVQLYTIAPDAQFLVTSRTVLRIRGERVWDVAPLVTADPAIPVTRAVHSPAVELFVERARAVRPDFALTSDNSGDVVALCRDLEGVPLAIELAAARMRVLTAHDIRTRLGRDSGILSSASRDLPERQRTLRATLEWSTALLDDAARALLYDLGVFSGSFTLEAIETVGEGRMWRDDVLDALATLVDGSLVQQDEVDGEPVFSMLATVREHAVARLRETGEERAMRDAHARYVIALAERCGPLVHGHRQLEAVARLDLERANLRAAVRHLVAAGDADGAARVAWPLYLYWWLRGYLPEVRVWMGELLDRVAERSVFADAAARFYVLWSQMWSPDRAELVGGLDDVAAAFRGLGDPFGVALAEATAGLARATSITDMARAADDLDRAAAEFAAEGEPWAESLCLIAMGRLAWVRSAPDEARAFFQRAYASTSAGGDVFVLSIATHHLGRCHLFAGELPQAARLYRDSIGLSRRLSHDEGVAYAIEGLCAVAALRGDIRTAATLAGAAEAIRQRVTMFDAEPFVFHTRYLREAADGADDVVAESLAHGRELTVAEAAELALERVPVG